METIKKLKRNHAKSELEKFKLFFEYPVTEKELRSDYQSMISKRK